MNKLDEFDLMCDEIEFYCKGIATLGVTLRTLNKPHNRRCAASVLRTRAQCLELCIEEYVHMVEKSADSVCKIEELTN